MTDFNNGSASGSSEIHNSHNHSASWHGGSVWNHGQVRGRRREKFINQATYLSCIMFNVCNTISHWSDCYPRYDKTADSAYTPNRIKNDDLIAILNQYPSLCYLKVILLSLPIILPSDYWYSRHAVRRLWIPDDFPSEVRLQRHQLHHHHHGHCHWVRHPPNWLYQARTRTVHNRN